MLKKPYILLLLLFALLACERNLTEVEIPINPDSNIKKGKALEPQTIKLIEGVYLVKKGKGIFGDKVVIKRNRERITIYAGANTAYCIMESAYRGSDIYIEGYWRYAHNYETGLCNLKIDAANGSEDLLKGISPGTFRINGTVEQDDESKYIEFEYQSALKSDSGFYIISHRGGGRNSDRLPASENSIEMINFAERLGANAVEIDVQYTKDKIPVLFHDANLSKRLINEDYFTGKVSDYSYKQLKTFCTLKHGERIPTLEDALKNIVENTDIKLVWLDIKDPALVEDAAKYQKQYIDMAASKGRDLKILIGIPDEAIMNAYLGLDNYSEHTALCELDSGMVEKTGAEFWAPRWTLGLQNDRVRYFQSLGKKAFVWTLDVPEFIHTFIRDGYFNGILSNYPTVVVYEYYVN